MMVLPRARRRAGLARAARIAEFREAVRLNPGVVGPRSNLGDALLGQGKAAEHARTAVALAPKTGIFRTRSRLVSIVWVAP
jgi:hypothetical protein